MSELCKGWSVQEVLSEPDAEVVAELGYRAIQPQFERGVAFMNGLMDYVDGAEQ